MPARVHRAVVFVALCLIGASTVYPLIFMALNSMRTAQAFEVNPYQLPTHYSLTNFRALFSQVPFLSSILHSIIVVVPAVILATLFSALAAFVFTKSPIKLGNLLFWVMLTVMFMPGIVILLPLYVQIAHLGLASNFTPAILIYTAINIPYGTYLLRSTFRAVPDSVIEAARVDGCGWLKIFLRVAMPMGKPGIMTVGILTFLKCLERAVHQPGAAAHLGDRDGNADARAAERPLLKRHPGHHGRAAARLDPDPAGLLRDRPDLHPRHDVRRDPLETSQPGRTVAAARESQQEGR